MTRARDLSEILNSTGLSVDTDTLVVDSANNRVGIGTDLGSRRLNVFSDTDRYTMDLRNESGYNSGELSGIVFSGRYDSSNSVTDMASIGGGKENTSDGNFGGRLSFFTRVHNGIDTERLRIDSSGQVKITDGGSLNFDAAVNGNYDIAYKSADNTFNIISNSSSAVMGFHTNSTERMRIDSVGTTTIKTDGSTQLVLNRADASIQNGNQIANLLVTGDDPSAGQSGAAISFTAGDAWATNSYPTNIIFSNDQSGTLAPRMTLDASGNLLVGQSSTTFPGIGNTTAGVSIRGTDGSFFSRALGSGDTNNVVSINRSTEDGNILGFQKDGTTVGSIGVDNNDNFYIGATTSGHSGFYFGNTNVAPMAAGTKVDNTIDLGTSDNRFIDLHLSGGVVLDENPTIVGTTVVNRTITSKTLDDYEEGTWIPAIAGWTGTFVGTYTKTGNTVFYALSTGTLSGSGSDIIEITGLPFDPSASQASGTVMAQHVNTSTGTANLVGYTMGGSKLRIYETLDNAGWNALTESSLTSGSSQFIISGTYTTA